jgi:hypothetical protein
VNIKRLLLMSGACGVLATAVSTALAQETSEVAEVVIVTGSYIRGTPEDAALPVDVISADDLEKIGSPTTLELIKGLTISNGVLGDTNQFDSAPSVILMNNGIALAGATFRPYALGGNPAFGFGASEGERNYKGTRVSASLSGDFGASTAWDVAVTYMRQKALRTGRDTIVNRFQKALQGFGGPNCTGTTPGANGCMWFNPFASDTPANAITGAPNPSFVPTGVGSNNNPELINWFFYNGFTETTSDIIVADAVLNGETGWKSGRRQCSLGARCAVSRNRPQE